MLDSFVLDFCVNSSVDDGNLLFNGRLIWQFLGLRMMKKYNRKTIAEDLKETGISQSGSGIQTHSVFLFLSFFLLDWTGLLLLPCCWHGADKWVGTGWTVAFICLL